MQLDQIIMFLVAMSLSALVVLAMKLAVTQKNNKKLINQSPERISIKKLCLELLLRFTLIELVLVRSARFKINQFASLATYFVISIFISNMLFWWAWVIPTLILCLCLYCQIVIQNQDQNQDNFINWKKWILYGIQSCGCVICFLAGSFKIYYQNIRLTAIYQVIIVNLAIQQFFSRPLLLLIISIFTSQWVPMLVLNQKYESSLTNQMEQKKVQDSYSIPVLACHPKHLSPTKVPMAARIQSDFIMMEPKIFQFNNNQSLVSLDSSSNMLDPKVSYRKKLPFMKRSKALLTPKYNDSMSSAQNLNSFSECQEDKKAQISEKKHEIDNSILEIRQPCPNQNLKNVEYTIKVENSKLSNEVSNIKYTQKQASLVEKESELSADIITVKDYTSRPRVLALSEIKKQEMPEQNLENDNIINTVEGKSRRKIQTIVNRETSLNQEDNTLTSHYIKSKFSRLDHSKYIEEDNTPNMIDMCSKISRRKNDPIYYEQDQSTVRQQTQQLNIVQMLTKQSRKVNRKQQSPSKQSVNQDQKKKIQLSRNTFCEEIEQEPQHEQVDCRLKLTKIQSQIPQELNMEVSLSQKKQTEIEENIEFNSILRNQDNDFSRNKLLEIKVGPRQTNTQLQQVDLNSPIKQKNLNQETDKSKSKSKKNKRMSRKMPKMMGNPYLEYLPNMLKPELQKIKSESTVAKAKKIKQRSKSNRNMNYEICNKLGISQYNNQNASPDIELYNF